MKYNIVKIIDDIRKYGVDSIKKTSENAKIIDMAVDLINTFSENECNDILGNSIIYCSGKYDKYFLKRMLKLGQATEGLQLLKNIYEKEGSFKVLKEYMLFRKDNSNLDYAENIFLSIYEYSQNLDLLKEIIENSHNMDEDKLQQVKNKLNGLMKLDNQIDIKTWEEFENSEEKEKEYYNSKFELFKERRIAEIKHYIKEQLNPGFLKENTTEELEDLFLKINNINDKEILKKFAVIIEKMKGHDIIRDAANCQELRKEFYFEVMVPLGVGIESKGFERKRLIDNLLRNGEFEYRQESQNPEKEVEENLKGVIKDREKLEIKQLISSIIVQDRNIEEILQLANSRNQNMINNSELNNIIELLNNVNETEDIGILNDMLESAISMIGTEELAQIRMDSHNIYEKLMEEYKGEYVDTFSKYENMTEEELAEIDGITVEYKNGIKIIELKGAPFKHLTHVGNITGESARCCASFISNDRFETFGWGSKKVWLYNNINSNNIKVMCAGDVGFTSGHVRMGDGTQLMTPENLASTYVNGMGELYTEVQISTGHSRATEEDKEKIISPNALMVNDSKLVESGIETCEKQEIRTLYVLHEDIYTQKREERNIYIEQNIDRAIDEYLSTMDLDKLNQILLYIGNSHERNKEVFQKISGKVDELLEKKEESSINENLLRKNIARCVELDNIECGRYYDSKLDRPINSILKLKGYLQLSLEEITKEKKLDGKWIEGQIEKIGEKKKLDSYDMSYLTTTYRNVDTKKGEIEEANKSIRETYQKRQNLTKEQETEIQK